MAWRAALLIYSLAGNRRDRKAGRGHGQYKAEGNSGPHAFAPGWDDFIEKIHAPSGASERIHAASGRAPSGVAIRTTHRSVSSSTRGRPHDLRNPDPSNFLAMSFRYQASNVSGFATAANSSKAFRPNRWAISANVAFSASDNNNLPLIWALRIRFSAARYSFLRRSSWSKVPVMYATMRAQFIQEPVLG